MPSDKRARKRANKQARQQQLEQARRRRSMTRRGAIVAVAVAAAVGIYFATSGSSSPASKTAAAKTSAKTSSGSSASSSSAGSPSAAASSASSSSSSASSGSSSGADTQAAMDKLAVAAGCPSNPKTVLKKPSYSSPPPLTISTSKTYTATVQTDVGTFTVSLDAAESPIAVNSFVFLADHGFFDCVTFHRVIPGFVVQGGDPTGTGSGGPGYQFTEHGPAAASNPAQQYPLGSVAMANSSSGTTDPNTNGSQFFIVTGPQGESLPPDYVLFGQVSSGMSVVQKISQDGTSGGTPNVIHRMLKVTVTSS